MLSISQPNDQELDNFLDMCEKTEEIFAEFLGQSQNMVGNGIVQPGMHVVS